MFILIFGLKVESSHKSQKKLVSVLCYFFSTLFICRKGCRMLIEEILCTEGRKVVGKRKCAWNTNSGISSIYTFI